MRHISKAPNSLKAYVKHWTRESSNVHAGCLDRPPNLISPSLGAIPILTTVPILLVLLLSFLRNKISHNQLRLLFDPSAALISLLFSPRINTILKSASVFLFISCLPLLHAGYIFKCIHVLLILNFR